MFFGYIDPGTGFNIGNAALQAIALFFVFFGVMLAVLKRFRIFFIFALIVALIIAGVMMKKQGSKFSGKIVILGFDGLSPEIIEPMIKEGSLPNFFRLMQQGSYSRLATTNPPQSPVAWAAFATGKNPGENGVFDFIVRDPNTYKLSLATADINKLRPVIKTEALWGYTSSAGVPAVIINCPLTFPPDKISGKMLSGMGVPDILGTEGTFTFYTTEILPKDKDIGGKVFSLKKNNPLLLHFIGPRYSPFGGKGDNLQVPFKVVFKDNNTIIIEYQKQKFTLKQGEWSGWKEVTFNAGLKKIKGILKFYLVQASPGFKLYISPINFDPRDPLFPVSWPKNYSKELAENTGLFFTQGMPLDTWAVNEGRLSEDNLLEQADEILREKVAILNFELKRFKKGVFFYYLGLTDSIQHMFWRDQGDKEAKFQGAIRDWYKKMDKVLGRVMQELDKQDTLIVLSDHGFTAFKRAVHINSWLRDNGYLYLNNPGQATGKELLQDVDWLKTKAYAIGFGAIYINQQGRELKGIVNPGKDAEGLKQEISRKLEQWLDPKGNQKIVRRVYDAAEIFRGKYAQAAPDLYIGFNHGYRASWQTALGAAPDAQIEENSKNWSGDHLVDPELVPGVIFSSRKIVRQKPSIYDILPTVLKIIGYNEEKLKKCGLQGDVLFSDDAYSQ